jgi:hypothetical protein
MMSAVPTSSVRIVVAQADLAAISALHLPSEVAVFASSELIDRYVVQRDGAGEPEAVESPGVLLGLVSVSSTGQDELRANVGRLALFFQPDVPERVELDGASQAELYSWVAGQLAVRGARLLRDGAQIRRALATLREEHAEVLERFGELEAAVGAFSTPNRIQKLNYFPTRAQIVLGGVTDRPAQRRIRQRLPTSPTGLATVELHVGAPPTGDSGALKVSLFVGGDDKPAHRWVTPAGQIGSGWLRLSLERALERKDVDIALEAEWEGAANQISLTLGAPTPLTEYGARTDTGLNLGAPLALRVWGMVAGSRVPDHDGGGERGSIAAAAAVKGQTRVALASNDLEGVQMLCPEPGTAAFTLVEYRPTQLDVLVHPVNGHATVAVIRGLSARNIGALSALVVVDNKEASAAVEFGIAAVAARPVYADPEALIQQWTRVEPMLYAEVAGTVESRHAARST